jgi:hypothetical protein
LEAASAAHYSLAADVDLAVIFIFDAQVVVEVDTAFDDLAAAIAFDFEGVIVLFRFGGRTAEEVFEKAHDIPFNSTLVVE